MPQLDALHMNASQQIREMFDDVAPGYDRANQILSIGVHHRWRRRLVKLAGTTGGQSVLDCATGTGDLAFEFRRKVQKTDHVVGIDFSEPMIALARYKAKTKCPDVEFMVGDVLKLPFVTGRFDIASIAFGIRNVDDPVAGLREMARVVHPGGKVAVLEFGQPEGGLFQYLYRWYSDRVIPTIGGWVTGRPASYRYLSDSAAAFPAGEKFVDLMRQADVFAEISAYPLTLKIAYAYIGTVK